jgi:Na+-transporting NADH:ubiquinone oxidoreductase subunit C
VALRLVKGQAGETDKAAIHHIDGISGATNTGTGVSNLLQFWFGEHGFLPFFEQLQRQGGLNG